MGRNTDERNGEAEIERLLRAAGRGPTASDDARSRIYAAVQTEWRRNTRAAAARAPRRATGSAYGTWGFWLMRALPAAAAVAAVAIGVRVLQAPPVAAGIDVATLTRANGAVAVVADAGSELAVGEVPATLHVGDLIRTTADGSVSLTLTNGLVLRVNTNTELLLAADDRIELRRGTAYVDSGPNPDAAATLVLETPFGAVSHIGTQYETRVGANNLRIRVREGIVNYATEAPSGESIEVRGSAGEQLLAIAGEDEIRRSTVARTGDEWAWVEDLASAPAGDTHALDELLEWIARETGRELRFADDGVAARARDETIVGAAGLTPEETLDVIALSSTQFDVERTDSELLVR